MSTARDILLRAAELMDDPANDCWGACEAIGVAATCPSEMRITQLVRESFAKLLKPKRIRSSYWLGPPQYMLSNEADRRFRQRRVYALLLAAEAAS